MNFVRLPVIPVIAFLLIMLTATIVQAAYRQGSLMLGNLRQAAEFTYSFSAHNYKNTSDRQQALAEKYYLSIDYAVKNPRLLNGSIALQLEADQFDSSGNTSGAGYDSKNKLLYNIKANLLDKSPLPLNIYLQSQVQDVETPFSGNYRYYYDLYGATWSVKNRYLPLTLNVLHSESRTTGLPEDRDTSHSEVSLHALNNTGISRTNMEIRTSTDRFNFSGSAEDDFARAYEFNVDNTLRWEKDRLTRNLYSLVRFKEEDGINEGRNFSLNESLDWELGRALKSGINYSLGYSSNFRDVQETSRWNVYLRHLLFQSLTTNLQGNLRDVDYGSGSEQEINGRISLEYRKNLPDVSSLALHTYWQYGETDRHSDGFLRPVLDEPHIVAFGQAILLDNPFSLAGSIIVRNENRAIRLQPYIAGVDYTIVRSGGVTEIVVSGAGLSNAIVDDSLLPGGNRLLISYQYLVEGDISFSTTNFGVGGDLNLYSGMYRFYSRLDKFDQSALSQDAAGLGLGSQTSFTAGFEYRQKKLFITTLYYKIHGSFQNMENIDATVNYDDTWGAGAITLFAKNSYRWYGETSGFQRGDEDIFSTGGTYRRPIIYGGWLTLTANYDRYMATIDTDRFSGSAQLNWYFRKLIVALQGRVSIADTGDSTSDVEYVRLSITRHF